MAGYDPFVELLPGTPIWSDGKIAVTTEGVFPLPQEAAPPTTVELTGTARVVVDVEGAPGQTHTLTAVGRVVVRAQGSLLGQNLVSGASSTVLQASGIPTQIHGAAADGRVVVAAAGSATIVGFTFVTGTAQIVVVVDGETLTVPTDVFIGWGIPAGVA